MDMSEKFWAFFWSLIILFLISIAVCLYRSSDSLASCDRACDGFVLEYKGAKPAFGQNPPEPFSCVCQ